MNDKSMYGPSEGKAGINRTYIQGMKPRQAANPDAPADPRNDKRVSHIDLQDRPLAGVLYSVSQDALGEIFPVYVGRNTIGSHHESDIYLSEQTVSPNHAVLLVRIIQNDGQRIVTMNLTDYDSEFGTAVNGMRLGYDREPLGGGELIQIGNAYQFIFMPLDAVPYGLGPNPDFGAVPRKENRPAPPSVSAVMPQDEEIFPTSVSAEDERSFYGRSQAQKVDHSSKKTL